MYYCGHTSRRVARGGLGVDEGVDLAQRETCGGGGRIASSYPAEGSAAEWRTGKTRGHAAMMFFIFSFFFFFVILLSSGNCVRVCGLQPCVRCRHRRHFQGNLFLSNVSTSILRISLLLLITFPCSQIVIIIILLSYTYIYILV